jgi:hypothetical protein
MHRDAAQVIATPFAFPRVHASPDLKADFGQAMP